MPLAYCGIRVTDLDRAVEFYTRTMGLRLDKRGGMDHGGVWADLSDPETHQRLELNYYPPDSPYATPFHPGEGLDHLGFEVPSASQAFRELVQKGARPALEPWRERNGVEIGYVMDPDGNWIEVFSRPRAPR